MLVHQSIQALWFRAPYLNKYWPDDMKLVQILWKLIIAVLNIITAFKKEIIKTDDVNLLMM